MHFQSKLVIPIAIGIVVLVLVIGGLFYYQSRNNQVSSNDSQAAQKVSQEEVKKLVAEVGKLIALPEGEDPTIATVTDIEKLRDQPFFQKAKNGDKVLIYTQAKKAILYDPQAKKIIDVAPINIGTESAQVSQVRVVLRNGTDSVGLTTRVEPKVKQSLSGAEVVIKENASRTDFEKTVVVVLNDSFKKEAEKLADDLGGSVENLPSGESKPQGADILVILGKDII